MNDGRRAQRGIVILVLLELALLALVFSALVVPNFNFAEAVVNSSNVTVTTLLQVGNVFPEVLNVTIDNDATSVDLVPNATKTVTVYVIARDFNGENDIINVTAEFFDMASSSFGAADDNNNHYTNNSCTIDTTYGDIYEINATCTFEVWYYANNATWNATVTVIDNSSLNDTGSDTISVSVLLALGLPDSIDYGTVNATAVSDEQLANVTNFGNTMFNLSLSGYAVTPGDGNAMNCTLGAVKNISIEYEKYNVTASNPGSLTLAQFESLYRNLTSSSVINEFNLDYRRNDTAPYIDDTNASYWRIYVPLGVAGSCTGNIVFGSVVGAAT
ncbi:hypothetical protein D6817_05890 [Candidatus Pacearchaeota archaeon]|nr:MAG: hypothetical protein D6817_05890 [Candidatus Pacearchaeota archaeon]